MTDLKKTIKREMTREKFERIRDHHYCENHKYIYDFTYGQVSSWLTWKRDKKGKVLPNVERKDVPDKKWIQNGHIYEGRIDEWDLCKSFSKKITTNIVFIGLNMSGDGKPSPENPCFQNARGHRRIFNTFFGTAAEGAYFTDIIKPDRRIKPKKGETLAKSNQVMEIIRKQKDPQKNDILKDHIRLFEEELKFIGAVEPLLIVFGGGAEWVLRQGIYNNFFTRKFHAIVVIKHYAHRFKKDIEYKKDTVDKLMPYIAIERER